jgi:hypothetical protein
MVTFQYSGHIGHDGHLKLDIPTGWQDSDVDVAVIVQPKAEAAQTQKYDFRDLAGKIRLPDDPVKFQRDIRDVW